MPPPIPTLQEEISEISVLLRGTQTGQVLERMLVARPRLGGLDLLAGDGL